MMDWCENKVVLITGSSSGIGEAAIIHFARLGAKVVVTGRNEENIDKVAADCEAESPYGYAALTVVADLACRDAIKKLVDRTIDHFGQLDILVNNAGIAELNGGIEDPKIMESYDKIHSINTAAVLYLCHLAAPHLIKTSGVIINLSSLAAKRPFLASTPNCMSKAAVDMLTQCLALELGPKGVRVNSINPWLVETPLFERNGFPAIKVFMAGTAAATPLRRCGNVKDTTELIEFLASPRASMITGQNITMDGGYSIVPASAMPM